MSSIYEKFHGDIFAVLSRWEFIILRIEALLLWERVIPSFFFNLMVHVLFWAFSLTSHSTLFVLSCVLSLLFVCDIFWKWIRLLFDDRSKSEGSFTHFVETALKSGNILSIEELSHWVASILYHIMSIVNGLAPCRRSRPLLFFLLTSSASLACIALSRQISGLAISYGILNICLIAPVLIYHKVLSRIWNTVKPILQRIEAEFDKNPLETASEREAGEAELYGPIVAAAAASQKTLPISDDAQALLSDQSPNSLLPPSESEDLDTSEAVFINQFVPKMSNEEIDKLFENALAGAAYPRPKPSLSKSEPDCATPWIMSDEYETDNDEVEDIVDEAVIDQRTDSVLMRGNDRDWEGFVVVPKSE